MKLVLIMNHIAEKSSNKMKKTTLLLSSFFFLLSLCVFFGKFAIAQNATIPVNIGVVLDFDKRFGKMALSCISMALSDFYETHHDYKTRLVLHTRDSEEDVVGAASAAIDLMKNIEVQAIIGPLTMAQANFIANLGEKAQVPIVSFSATSPSLSLARTPYFIRAAQNDSLQAQAIGAIVKNYGWRAAIPIIEDGDYGNGIIPYLNYAMQEFDARVPYCSAIPASTTDDQIIEELQKLMKMQTRVFILHMTQSLGSRLLLKAKEVGMLSENYAWILTNGLANLLNSMDSSIIDSMQGTLSVKTYVPRSEELDNFTVRWRMKFEQENPHIQRSELSVFGLWAYDVIWALAMATEKVGGKNFVFHRAKNTRNNTDLESISVSQIGPRLLQEISRSEFKGLSGKFSFIDRQLQSSIFEIVNVVGNGGRVVGFWTPTAGILRDLNLPTSSKYATLKSDLRPIIWPGDSTTTPKGWATPSTGKKLRIGVPLKKGFTEFLNVEMDPMTNETMFAGFCIDMFVATMEALPYAVPYEFIPIKDANIESHGGYNDLIYQVYLKKYDAVVGDTTIIANRSLYVDFTLPYTESGLSLIVPIKDNGSKNAWVFLKPLTLNLWVTSATFFVFIGFVVWVLEHRINEHFRGPPSHQLGTIFYFSFSTLVFSHRERVINNLARFVVIIWVFVVLILSSSYTANLSSMLTLQQLQPPITDIKELLKNNENVGYQEGSFVEGLLKQMNFDSSQLKAYGSPEECDKLFSMGSQNGGIAAALDEIPYMKLLDAKYCDKYTTVQQRFSTEGFGFVFSKGSPLVLDISRAILNVKEGQKMREIEKVWLGNQSSCPNTLHNVPSTSLSLDSFWGLFLIAGVTSIFALAIYLTIFFYNHRHILTSNEASIWQRMVMMTRFFDQRDLSSHTFRKSNYNDKNTLDVNVDALTHTNSPQNISSNTFSSINLQQMSNSCNSNQEAPTSQGIVLSLEIQNVNQVEMAIQNVADEINDDPT